MRIVTCVKQMPDPESPASLYSIDDVNKKVVPSSNVPPDVSDYDRYGVEAALMLKDKDSDVHISVVSLGIDHSLDVIKRPVAMGCDDLYLIQGEELDDPDPSITSHGLVAAVKQIGDVDLVTFGRQSGNRDQASVGPGVAVILGWPCVTNAVDLEDIGDGKLRVERLTEGGTEIVEVNLPAVLTFSSEMPHQPRYATMRGIMQAKRVEPTIWSASDLGFDAASLEKIEVFDVFFPTSTTEVEIIEADSPADAGRKLAQRLREARVI